MITRIILFLVSFCMMVFGLSFILIYINLFTFGYNIYEYLEYIFKRIECLCFFCGFLLMLFLLKKRRKK